MGILFNYVDHHTTNAPITDYDDQLYKLQSTVHIGQRIINGGNILRDAWREYWWKCNILVATGRVIISSLNCTGEDARFYKYRHQNE